VVAQGRAGMNPRAKVGKSLWDSSYMSRGEIRHSAHSDKRVSTAYCPANSGHRRAGPCSAASALSRLFLGPTFV